MEIPNLKEAKKPRAFNPHEFVRNVMGGFGNLVRTQKQGLEREDST